MSLGKGKAIRVVPQDHLTSKSRLQIVGEWPTIEGGRIRVLDQARQRTGRSWGADPDRRVGGIPERLDLLYEAADRINGGLVVT
jgi:hypothetical protein